jgi:hypothetical protein
MTDLILSPEEADEIAERDAVFGGALTSTLDESKSLVRKAIDATPSPKDTAAVGTTLAEVLQEGDRYVAKIPGDVVEGLSSGRLEKMRKGSTDLWNGTIRKAGGDKAIEAQANFEEVNLSRERLEGLRALALQAQIREISNQLNELGEKIDDVLEGQHSDRVAEVKSGIETYESANEYNDADRGDRRIANAQQDLTNGRKKLELWLHKILDDEMRELEGVKEQALAAGGIHKPRIERLNELESKEQQIQEALQYYVLASGYIFRIHAAQGELDAAETFVGQHLQSVAKFGDKLQDETIPLPPKVADRGRQMDTLYDKLTKVREESIRLEFPASYLLKKSN